MNNNTSGIILTKRLTILIYTDADNRRRATLVLDGNTYNPTDLMEFVLVEGSTGNENK